MTGDCRCFRYRYLIAAYLLTRGIRNGIDRFSFTYGCLRSFLRRERLHDSIVRDLAEDLRQFFPYSEGSSGGLVLYVYDQPELKMLYAKNKNYDRQINERILEIKNSLKTEEVDSLPDPSQIDEEKIIRELTDGLRKCNSIKTILSQ